MKYNIADSSAWLEYFAGSKNAKLFQKIIENGKALLVPTIILYEVTKKLLHELGEEAAFTAAAYMKTGHIIDLDIDLALYAAKLSKEHALPMADSIILATARRHDATVWTQDADFKGLKNVEYFPK